MQRRLCLLDGAACVVEVHKAGVDRGRVQHIEAGSNADWLLVGWLFLSRAHMPVPAHNAHRYHAKCPKQQHFTCSRMLHTSLQCELPPQQHRVTIWQLLKHTNLTGHGPPTAPSYSQPELDSLDLGQPKFPAPGWQQHSGPHTMHTLSHTEHLDTPFLPLNQTKCTCAKHKRIPRCSSPKAAK
jgi:hypothetical protein